MTVFLVIAMSVAVATLFGLLYGASRDRDGSNRPWSTHHSRRGDGLALLGEWMEFEGFMKRELYGKLQEVPLDDLSGIIVDFSLLYDLNPEEIRSILRTRNAIFYNQPISSSGGIWGSSGGIWGSLSELRSIFEKLRPVWDNQHNSENFGDHIFASSGVR